MFWTRLASGIVLMAVTIALMVYGSYPLFLAITAISLIGLYELYKAVQMEKTIPAFAGYISSIVTDILVLNNEYEYLVMWLVFTLMVFMACYVIAYPEFNSEQITMLFFGIIYVTIMLSFIFKVRFVQDGHLLVWFIYIGAWGSDTFAYCTGKLIGKHKMPSKLSPNKTIEGCLGGVLGAALAGLIFAMVFYNPRAFGHGVIHPLPCVWQRCELAEEFVVELAVVFHFTCPDGVAVGEAHHIHVHLSIIIAEHFRVNAIIHPSVSYRFGIRPHRIRGLGVHDMDGMQVFAPVVHRPVGMHRTIVVKHVVGMYLVVAAARAFTPIVVHVNHVDRAFPVYKVR